MRLISLLFLLATTLSHAQDRELLADFLKDKLMPVQNTFAIDTWNTRFSNGLKLQFESNYFMNGDSIYNGVKDNFDFENLQLDRSYNNLHEVITGLENCDNQIKWMNKEDLRTIYHCVLRKPLYNNNRDWALLIISVNNPKIMQGHEEMFMLNKINGKWIVNHKLQLSFS